MIGPLQSPYHHLIEHLLDVLENSGYGVVRTFGSASVSELVAAVAEWYRYRIVACLVPSSSPVPLKTHHVGER
ncbi:hypothetical protein TNCV_3053271 [Trichonephila clavipes]|uniref:Uncharacterized protein n=1 Tax=Trichonephila clavipes TaxID=2585209 RepID=A0A8X6RSW3_TRICX|nr:hypothetical protein TNCV_3053271 [Trichonephila clavipes]